MSDVVGIAEILIKAVDAGFEAELKQKVGSAVDKASAGANVVVGLDTTKLEAARAAELRAQERFLARMAAAGRLSSSTSGADPAKAAATATAAAEAAANAASAASKIKAVGDAVDGLPGADKIGALASGLEAAAAAGLTAAAVLPPVLVIVTLLAAAFVALRGVGNFRQLAAELGQVQQATGGTAEEASRLRGIAVALGIPLDALAAGLTVFGRNLEINEVKLAKFGVAAVKGKDGQTELSTSLIALVAAYRSLDDPLEKARLRQLALSQSGLDMNKILSKTPEELERIAKGARSLDQAGINSGAQLTDTMNELHDISKDLTTSIGEGLVPVLIDLANAGRVGFEWVNAAADKIGGLANVVAAGARSIPGLGTVINLLGLIPGAHDDGAAAADRAAAAEVRLSDQRQAAANKAAAAAAGIPDATAALAKARAAAADQAVNATKAEETLENAQQRVSDLQVGFAEQAAAAKEAWAARALASNRQVEAAEGRLAEVVRSNGQKIADDEAALAAARIDAVRTVAEAKRQAVEADLAAHRSTRDAERALSDERARQNAGGNAALLRQLQNAGAINSATEAVARAREKERETARGGVEAIAKAESEGLTKVQLAQRTLDRDRAESARQVAEAERSVTDARTEQNKVAEAGLEIGRQTAAQARQMREAVEAVEKAQRDLTAARAKDALENTANLAAEAQARAALLVLQREATGETIDAVERNKVLAGVIEGMLKSLDPSSPGAQALLGTSLIVRGLVGSLEEAANQTKRWKDELALINAQIDQSGPGGGKGAARNALQALLDGGGRAWGGPARPGYTYTVGEHGPERLDMFRGGGAYVTPLAVPRSAPPAASNASGPLIGQLVVQGATVAGAYATGAETARAVRAGEYARTGR